MYGERVLLGWQAIEMYMDETWHLPPTTFRDYRPDIVARHCVMARSFGRTKRRRWVFTLPSILDNWIRETFYISHVMPEAVKIDKSSVKHKAKVDAGLAPPRKDVNPNAPRSKRHTSYSNMYNNSAGAIDFKRYRRHTYSANTGRSNPKDIERLDRYVKGKIALNHGG